MDAQHTKHVTYKLAYHFVWYPKYRKKLLVGKIATFLEQEIRRICAEHLDNETFRKSFSSGRSMYFDESEYETPHIAHHMSTLDAISSVADENDKGGYRFDRMVFNGPFDILGFFLGYMSGPIIEEASEEREIRQSRLVPLPEEPCPIGIAS